LRLCRLREKLIVPYSGACPTLLNNPAHWQLRAQGARLLAAALEDPEAKSATLKIADEYDRLAVRATERMAAEAADKERR
jgi:hypothetical protein